MKVQALGDAYLHTLTRVSGTVILDNVSYGLNDLPGYSKDWSCQCGGPEFKGWSSDDFFIPEVRAPSLDGSKMYVYHVAGESQTGKILIDTFARVKTQ
jgi:hypothetical protein